MKFDFVIGNPPYQEEAKEGTIQAKPVYHLFVSEAKKVTADAVVMITPARWFSGGMGLDAYREEMLSDNKISKIIEYANAKECFPMNSISGGISIFCWKKGYEGACEFVNVKNGMSTSMTRYLNEFPILVRNNGAVDLIHRIQSKGDASMASIVSAISPFALSTKERGSVSRSTSSDLHLYSSAGDGYLAREKVSKGLDLIDVYKVMLSQTGAEHAGEPSKEGTFRVLSSSMRVLKPGEICTHSYIILGAFTEVSSAENVCKYLKTRFARYLILQAMASIHISKVTFSFVPLQDFTSKSDIDWSKPIPQIDQQLYSKYGLTEDEIAFIETHVKEMT